MARVRRLLERSRKLKARNAGYAVMHVGRRPVYTHRLVMSILLGRALDRNAPFPLTPTLSLGEREPRSRSLEPACACGWPGRGHRSSLSPRERAGVRGKVAGNHCALT